jgi:transcriptional regulator with XRE-family HTH domain
VTPQSFGQRLRRQRDRRRLTLAEVEARTKVSARLFRSLEEGDCARWPGGIYSRSYVRAYAVAVGMDPEETVAAFTACYPQFAAEPLPDPAAEVAPPALAAVERLKAACGVLAKNVGNWRRGVRLKVRFPWEAPSAAGAGRAPQTKCVGRVSQTDPAGRVSQTDPVGRVSQTRLEHHSTR